MDNAVVIHPVRSRIAGGVATIIESVGKADLLCFGIQCQAVELIAFLIPEGVIPSTRKIIEYKIGTIRRERVDLGEAQRQGCGLCVIVEEVHHVIVFIQFARDGFRRIHQEIAVTVVVLLYGRDGHFSRRGIVGIRTLSGSAGIRLIQSHRGGDRIAGDGDAVIPIIHHADVLTVQAARVGLAFFQDNIPGDGLRFFHGEDISPRRCDAVGIVAGYVIGRFPIVANTEGDVAHAVGIALRSRAGMDIGCAVKVSTRLAFTVHGHGLNIIQLGGIDIDSGCVLLITGGRFNRTIHPDGIGLLILLFCIGIKVRL